MKIGCAKDTGDLRVYMNQRNAFLEETSDNNCDIPDWNYSFGVVPKFSVLYKLTLNYKNIVLTIWTQIVDRSIGEGRLINEIES